MDIMQSIYGTTGVAPNTVRKKAADAPGAVEDDLSSTAPFFSPGKAKLKSMATQQGKLRVACYIRVSSTSPTQEDSYEAQEKYFSTLLRNHVEWSPVGVYCDYGRSGTQTATRTGFNRLMRHCEQGRVDRVICKSISRFSRNVADLVESIRKLRDCGVTIFFEKENLDTADMKSEFILTTLAAIAQEESRSISENILWGNRKRFPKGNVRNIALYGYRFTGEQVTTEDGYRLKELAIVDEEAEVVRRIFADFLDGKPMIEIARALNAEGVSSGREHGWTGANIGAILSSERYCGDVRVQKMVTTDHLTHKVVRNEGQAPQYYIKDHHPAIIDRDTYEKANSLRVKTGRKTAINYPLSGRLICGNCGRHYTVDGKGRINIWRCATALTKNGMDICHAEKLTENEIVAAVQDGLSRRFGKNLLINLEAVQEFDFVETDRNILKKKIMAVAEEGKDTTGLEKALEEKEKAWELMERDYAAREKAIDTLKRTKKLDAGKHLQAIVLSITVYADHFSIRWFDDTTTDVKRKKGDSNK